MNKAMRIRVYVLPPCKDCKKRHEACHSDCPEYLEYKAENERIKAAKSIDSGRASHWKTKWHEV